MHGVDFPKMTLECPTHFDGLANFTKRALGGGYLAHGATLLLCTDGFNLVFEAGHLHEWRDSEGQMGKSGRGGGG